MRGYGALPAALFASCVLISFLSVTQAFADVNVDWDRSVSFPAFETFGLETGTSLSNPLATLRIEQAVSAALVEKGLRQDPAPALLVIVHASVEPSRSLNLESYKEGEGVWQTEMPQIRSIDAGTLLVDLLEASTRRLIWRGIATDIVTNNPTRNEKPVPKALRRMLRKFPPPVAAPG